MIRTLCTIPSIISIVFAYAQNPDKSFTVKYVAEILKIDGILDEHVWKTVDGPGALISGGGEDSDRDFNTSWDAKWLGEAKMFENYCTAELAIPLTSFKFREGETKCRFQSYKFDMQTNERSAWQPQSIRTEIPVDQFEIDVLAESLIL